MTQTPVRLPHDALACDTGLADGSMATAPSMASTQSLPRPDRYTLLHSILSVPFLPRHVSHSAGFYKSALVFLHLPPSVDIHEDRDIHFSDHDM